MIAIAYLEAQDERVPERQRKKALEKLSAKTGAPVADLIGRAIDAESTHHGIECLEEPPVVSLNQLLAEFSFCTPSARPPPTYTFKLTAQLELLAAMARYM